jgi:ribosomal protein S12 methylthiotransferase accessory factor
LSGVLAERGITRVARLTGLDIIGLPVFAAIRPRATTITVSSGKGEDDVAAQISAVMESLELDAAERWQPQQVRTGTAAELGVGYAVRSLAQHPLSCVDDATVVEWTPAVRLGTRDRAWLPVRSVGLRGGQIDRWDPPSFLATTNGLACGATFAEAVEHALLELCERDSLARYEHRMATPVGPGEIGDDTVTQVWRRVDAAGLHLVAARLPSLPGLHTSVAYLTGPDMPMVFSGSGCSTDPNDAIRRAVFEAVQSRTATISGSRDDIPSHTFDANPVDLSGVTISAVTAGPPSATGPGQAGSNPATDELWSIIERRTGGPVLAVDLTPPTCPWPYTVQVFAPGLLPSLDAEPGARVDYQR